MDKVDMKWVLRKFGEWFGEPCNYTLDNIDVAWFMMNHRPEYCDANCGQAKAEECWLEFLEALKEGE